MVDHYSDHIAPPPRPRSRPSPRTFHPGALARLIAGRRAELGWSTRRLAQRAEISQAYVVALERAAADPSRPGPTPSLDVAARLAHALGLEVEHLVATALRPAGRHVLLVCEGSAEAALTASTTLAAGEVERWLVAGKHIDPLPVAALGAHTIDVRRDTDGYDPDRIAATLEHELAALVPPVAGTSLGLVFAETGEVMATIDRPTTVLEFERRWGAVARDAAARRGAHAARNVCVYSPASLRSLPDPVAAAVHLLDHHDDVWLDSGDRRHIGVDAARRLLAGLRPAGTAAPTWRRTVDDLLHHLGLAA